MSNSATINREQLRTVLIATELGGKIGDSNHFSYAKLANSSSSFGQMQFDVDANPASRAFLADNGFDATDIAMLRKHGNLSDKDQAALDTKLQAIPQVQMDQFTDQQLDVTIERVSGIIDEVRAQNPAAADAVVNDTKLQLGIADYANQFSSLHDAQLVGFLAGNPERGIQAGNPPIRDDMQNFIGASSYGHKHANTRAIAGREERFNEAMGQLGLGPATQGHSHASAMASAVLKQGMHNDSVKHAQEELHDLGYLQAEPNGRFGPQTNAATEDFQRAQGLHVDGKIGPATQQHLDSATRDKQIEGMTTSVALLRDFNDPSHPQNALYNTLKEEFPAGVSAEVLSQCTAACYMAGIKQPNDLGNVTGMNGSIVFESNSLFGSGIAKIDMSQPTPSVQQTMQNVQQFDQQQAINSAQFQTQQAQINAQASHEPTQ